MPVTTISRLAHWLIASQSHAFLFYSAFFQRLRSRGLALLPTKRLFFRLMQLLGWLTAFALSVGAPTAAFAAPGQISTLVSAADGLASTWGIALDGNGNLYIGDFGNHRVVKRANNGAISTFAGTGTQGATGDSGAASAAKLDGPNGVAVGLGGNIYISDGSAHVVRRVDGAGTIDRVAGTYYTPGALGDNGPALSALLNSPQGLAVDSSGNLYIANQGSNRIRKVAASDSTITTVAGGGPGPLPNDGWPATNAYLGAPTHVLVAANGDLYISETVGCRVRKLWASSGIISTIVGDGTASGTGDNGPAVNARVNQPGGLALDASGNLYIAEFGSHVIRKVNASDGIITTVAGTPNTPGYSGDGGSPTSATLNGPIGVAVDASGKLYIADFGNTRIRLVEPPAAPDAPTIGTATAGNGQASVSFTAPASNGGASITGYTVTASPGGFTGTGAGSPITVTGLTNGTAYTFTVTATNGVGTGSASAASNSVTPATVPGTPTIGTATAGNGQATVSFTAPASNGGASITGYTVTSSPGGITGTGTSSPITLTGLTNGTAYTFTVTATNSVGTGSASAVSNAVTPQAGPAVTSVAVPANGTYGVGAQLNFTVSWDQSITVSGTPRIALVIGATTVYANYVSSPTATNTLFRYTVLPGQSDSDGITIGALASNGGTIQNSNQTDATLTLNSVASTAAVLVNTIPVVGSVSPNSGPSAGGTSVVITGTNMTGATAVKFGATNASYVVNTNTQITATSPGGSAGVVDITVTAGSGTSATSSNDRFTYQVVGACGNATATASIVAPATNLCAANGGTPTAVSAGASSWGWTCQGSNGGADAICTTPYSRTSTNTGSGHLAITASSGGAPWSVSASSFVTVPSTGAAGPAGITFPHGLIDLIFTGGTAGSAVTVDITFPTALPAGTVWWKYGPTASNPTAHWYQYPATITGNVVTLVLTDNADGDDDYAIVSQIRDPGGPGVPGSATGIPTLSEWGLIILNSLMALFGLWQVRRRRVSVAF